MKYKQVEGENNLFRDTENGAIINTDRSAFVSYRNRREQKLKEMDRIKKLENEIDEIKSILYKVIYNF